ncbi:tripartite motif-containing protein 16-like [Sphaeramia orbicularis]|uniref:tripartite motif-containing protein 16-like n=1 Tax=Sphaeramia orbicularis TaxID=375764 RepID=UPI00117E47EC|nr:tripartite motif-containing protein 16-like [Sphaeramia orbicularis]
MAQQGVQLNHDRFSCSICLDLLKDPVAIPCGHSYCMNCIKAHWDGEDEKNIHSCPQCRQTFRPRPVLEKNIMLADLVEALKKTGLQAAAAGHCYAGPGDVACDFCTDRKLKAVKSCLQCLVSYCHRHLQPHHDVPQFKKHKLVEPLEKLQESMCSRHDEVMKMFCRTDQQCICYLCSVDEHKGHDTVTSAAGRTEKQTELELSRQKIQQRIKDKHKDMKVLQQEVKTISNCADEAEEQYDKILTEMILLLEERRRDVKQRIRSKEETEMIRVKELESKLEQEITELRRKDAEMDKLSHTDDHIQFLLQYPSVSKLSEDPDSPSINICPPNYFEDVTTAVSELRDKLLNNLRERWTNTSVAITEPKVLLSISQPEPQTRAEFLQYSCEITLDPNTMNSWLSLSEGNRKVTVVTKKKKRPFHPDRFRYCEQVLSKESLTGRCYWEVELRWGWCSVFYIAVTYKDIKRKGKSKEYTFGLNDKSWALSCTKTGPLSEGCHFYHKEIKSHVSFSFSSRMGVYLDHTAGILSFYEVSETMTLIHRVQTTFTGPLYAGIGLHSVGDTVEFIQLK